ncbi:MAG: hypothetical protein ACYTGC_14640 [Planctomycetota bacterium]|jgi:hypothetical protein
MNRLQRSIRFFPLFGRQWRRYVDGLAEAALFPDESSRADAVDGTCRRIARDWRFDVVHTAALFLIFAGLYLAVGQLWLGKTLLAAVVAAVLAVLIVEPAVYWAMRRFASRHLRARLIELGIPVCGRCGYDLRHLDPGQTSCCPECGIAIPRAVTDLIARQQDHDA